MPALVLHPIGIDHKHNVGARSLDLSRFGRSERTETWDRMNPLPRKSLAKSIAALLLIPAMTDRRSTIPMFSVPSRSLQVVQGLCLTARFEESVVPVAAEDRDTTEMQLVKEESTAGVSVQCSW